MVGLILLCVCIFVIMALVAANDNAFHDEIGAEPVGVTISR
jgi:hypothetical protein